MTDTDVGAVVIVAPIAGVELTRLACAEAGHACDPPQIAIAKARTAVGLVSRKNGNLRCSVVFDIV